MQQTINIKLEGYPSIADIQITVTAREGTKEEWLQSEFAHWIDENMVAARCLFGGYTYKQGEQAEHIKQWLKNGGKYDGLDDCVLLAEKPNQQE